MISTTSSMTARQRRVLWSSSSGMALEMMDIMLISFTLSVIITDFGLTGTQGGWIGTITNLGMLLGGITFGRLADKYGRVKIFSYTIFIFAFATAGMFFVNTYWGVLVLRFLAGVGAGGEYGVGMALVAEAFHGRQMGKKSSVIAVAGQVGAVVSAILAWTIMPYIGWRGLFLIGIVPVALAFWVRKGLSESQAWTVSHCDTTSSIKELFGSIRLARRTVVLSIMAVIQIAGYFGLMNWLPTIMKGKLQFTSGESSMFMVATIVGMSIGMFAFGKIFDRFGPRCALTLFLLASALSVFAFAFVTTKIALFAVGMTVGFFANGMFGAYGAVVSVLYPVTVRSTANNVVINVGRAIGGFSSVAIGFLFDRYDLTVIMGCLSALYVGSFLLMLTLPELRHKSFKNIMCGSITQAV